MAVEEGDERDGNDQPVDDPESTDGIVDALSVTRRSSADLTRGAEGEDGTINDEGEGVETTENLHEQNTDIEADDDEDEEEDHENDVESTVNDEGLVDSGVRLGGSGREGRGRGGRGGGRRGVRGGRGDGCGRWLDGCGRWLDGRGRGRGLNGRSDGRGLLGSGGLLWHEAFRRVHGCVYGCVYGGSNWWGNGRSRGCGYWRARWRGHWCAGRGRRRRRTGKRLLARVVELRADDNGCESSIEKRQAPNFGWAARSPKWYKRTRQQSLNLGAHFYFFAEG